jgi:5-methylcytosine-specific restriction enzyme subunit McrC
LPPPFEIQAVSAKTSSVREISEWDELFIPGAILSANDRQLAQQLAPSRRLLVDEMLSGIRIRSQSWVGLVRFDRFDVRVVPKLSDGNARLVQMLALTGGLDVAWHSQATRELHAESADDLLDLLSLLLVRECERILAGGVLHDYIEREEALPVVRGRFLADRQCRKRFGQFHVLECRFDEHESDIDENRLLAFTLGISKRLLRNPTLFRRVLSLYEQFASICECEYIDPNFIRGRLIYHRLNAHYADAHRLCWLILGSMGITDLLASGSLRTNVFLLDMNLLFERFVQKLLEFSLEASYRVEYQKRSRSILWDVNRHRTYGTVIPDFKLAGPEGSLIVDSKYKLGDKLDPGDIYQCFLHAQAFGNVAVEPSHAMLMVPSTSGLVEHWQLQVRSAQGAPKSVLHRIAVPVAAAADEMQAQKPGAVAAKIAKLVSEAVA